MTEKEINEALFTKLNAEMEEYTKWLLAQSPENILLNSCDYNLRQDIMAVLSYQDISASSAKRLLDCPDLLQRLADYWENSGRVTDYQKKLLDMIEDAGKENKAA